MSNKNSLKTLYSIIHQSNQYQKTEMSKIKAVETEDIITESLALTGAMVVTLLMIASVL